MLTGANWPLQTSYRPGCFGTLASAPVTSDQRRRSLYRTDTPTNCTSRSSSAPVGAYSSHGCFSSAAPLPSGARTPGRAAARTTFRHGFNAWRANRRMVSHPTLRVTPRRWASARCQHHGPAPVSGRRKTAYHRHDRSLLGAIQQLEGLGAWVVT
jgi:hypothetical protein